MRLNRKIPLLLRLFKIKVLNNVFLFNSLLGVFCFVVFLFAFRSTFNLKTEYSLKQFYPANHPLLVQEEHLRKMFQADKNLSIFLVLKTKDASSWLTNSNFALLKTIQHKFEKNSDLKSVVSLASIQGAASSNEELSVGYLFDGLSYAEKVKLAATHPFIKPHLLVQDETASLFILNLKSATPLEIYDYSQNLKSYFTKNFPTISVDYGGIPAVQADLSVLLKKEMRRSIFIGFFIFVLGLLLVYKRPVSIVPVLLTLVFVNVVVLGLLAAFGIPINVLLSTLPILISLDVISLVIHTQAHFQKTKNTFKTFKDLFWENLLAAATTGIGFLILKTSPSGLIQNYGLIVAVSSIAVWSLVHLVSIPLFAFFPDVEFRSWIHKPAYWSLWSLKNRKTVLFTSLLVFVFGFYSLTKVNWNSKILDDLPEHQNTRATTEYIDKNFGGTLEANFVITTKASWQKTNSLKKLDSVVQKIKGYPTVGSVVSVTDFYKSLSGTSNQRLPASSSELAEKNFMFSLSATNPIDKFISENNKNLLLQVRFKDMPSNIIQTAKINILSILKKEFPKSKVSFFGFGTQYHAINKEISKDLVFSFWHALLAIGILLAFVFRSWRWALLACLPNLIPPLVLLIWLNLNQIALKPSVAIVFSIAIGLAFTNTVYIVGRILKLQRAHNYENYFPLKKTLIEESNPCLLATTLVILGFSVFLFSYFSINRVFGQYMILSVIAALFGDLIFMPSFIQQFKKYLASALFITLSVSYSKSSAAENEAEVILKKAQTLLASKDDSAKISMKIIEANGSKKERQIKLKRKYSSSKNQVLVKILKPADQKGAGLLSVVENGAEQQWLYLPSSKQVRRFVSKNKQEGVLGSELSPQDLDLSTAKSAKVTFLKKATVGAIDVSLIEIKSTKNETQYAKAVVWIDQKLSLPLRIEYYDSKNSVVKRIDFQNYKLFNGVFRAQLINIKNLENKRGTLLSITDVKVNSGLSDDDFTQRALSKD
ncbi:MAG: outer membrane lipoprotein-sorting protein [Pseudobdellovibrio sp.]